MSTNGKPTARVYRGRSTAELIPTIQAELGHDAIVVARRSGLEGGIGGFFQRPFVEIEAQPGVGSIDLYDGGQATPAVELPVGSHHLLDRSNGLPAASHDLPAPSNGSLASHDLPAPSSGSPTSQDLPAPSNGVAAGNNDLPARGNERLMGESLSTRPPGSAPLDELLVAPLSGDASGVANGSSFDSEFASLLALATKPASAAPEVDTNATAEQLADPASYGPYRAAQEVSRRAQAVAVDQHPEPLDAATTEIPLDAAIAEIPLDAAQHRAFTAAPEPPRSKVALAVARELAQLGFDEAFAAELIAEATSHVLPFAGRIGLRRGVRIALERRIPVASPLPATGAALALVGPGGSGKTKCAATLASAYREGGALPVGCASICAERDALKMVFSPQITTPTQARSQRALKALASARAEGVVLLDTPAVSPSQTAELKELARVLAEIAPDRTIAMMPATLGARAASQLLKALRPLKPAAIAITHADETDQLGVAVQAACEAGLAPEYVLTSARGARSIERVDPAKLVERLLP